VRGGSAPARLLRWRGLPRSARSGECGNQMRRGRGRLVQAWNLHPGARVWFAGPAGVQRSMATASFSSASPANTQGSVRSGHCGGALSIQRRSREKTRSGRRQPPPLPSIYRSSDELRWWLDVGFEVVWLGE
jgi:hypothetical protein